MSTPEITPNSMVSNRVRRVCAAYPELVVEPYYQMKRAALILAGELIEAHEALQEADRLYSNYALLAQAPEAGPWINKVRATLAKAVPPCA